MQSPVSTPAVQPEVLAEVQPEVLVAALYQFAPFDDPQALREPLLAFCAAQGIKGTLLLADEGINGTVAGPAEGIAALVDHLRALPHCAGLEVKYATAPAMPFGRLKVRLKREIVTMGVEGIDPLASVGTYVEPEDWNALISDPDTIVIDTRNAYEVEVGTFAGAIDPGTASFREFPGWFRRERERLMAARGDGASEKGTGGNGGAPRVAMFCTGGIRCEKSTAFLKSEGIDEVYHLKGGILNYLEKVPAGESLWQGDCYVFDARVAVGHGLVPGGHVLCGPCGHPVSPQGQQSPLYRPGISCPACAVQD